MLQWEQYMWSHPDIRSADPSNIGIRGLCPKLDKVLCEEGLFLIAVIGKGINSNLVYLYCKMYFEN